MSLFDKSPSVRPAAPTNYNPSVSYGADRQTGMSAQAANVLRNTYMLLSMTLLFSGGVAYFAMVSGAPSLGLFSLVIYFGLLFGTQALRNSAWGILMVFALTGFLGYTLGPLLSAVLKFPQGPQVIATALTGTGVIFVGLSAYALTTKKDFSFMGGFLAVGIMVAFLAGLANIFFQLPILSLVLSAVMVLLMSGLILYQTSEIIHGGEDNYIMATVTLYVSIYNLFISLIQLLMAFSGGDD